MDDKWLARGGHDHDEQITSPLSGGKSEENVRALEIRSKSSVKVL